MVVLAFEQIIFTDYCVIQVFVVYTVLYFVFVAYYMQKGIKWWKKPLLYANTYTNDG